MTEGEQRVGRALGPQRNAGDAVTLWWQEPVLADLRLGGDRCPDFVILDAAYGLFVLEVKDWAIDQIQDAEPRHWTVRKGGTSRKETAPAEQAKAASFVLRNLIEANSKLRQAEGSHQNKALLPVEYGAVLPNIRREQARTRGLLDVLAGQHYYFQDDLQGRRPEESAPLAACLRASVTPRFHFAAVTPELIAELSEILQPKKQFDAPPDLRTEGERLLIERLDAEQREYAQSIGDGHRILTGCAGSGKTLVVAARGRFLKQAHPEWRVRILCFNAELVPHIYALLGNVQTDADPKIVVQNFHAFARECLGSEFQRNEREDDTAFAHRTEQAFLAFAAVAPKAGLFDALLIDEGQDLQPDWTRALVSLVNPATQSVLFAASRQQNIYGITSYKNLGIDAAGRTKHLRTSYRCSDEIIALAEAFQPDLLQKRVRPALDGSGNLFTSRHGSRRLPQFVACSEVEAVQRYICGEIARYMEAGQCDFKDIAVLYTNKYLPELEALATALCNRFGPQHVFCKWKAGNRLMPDDDSIKLVTVHGSKGLGWRVVFVLGLDKVPRPNFSEEKERSLAYVALTRAEDEIHFVSLREQGFHKDLKQLSLTLAR